MNNKNGKMNNNNNNDSQIISNLNKVNQQINGKNPTNQINKDAMSDQREE